MGRTPEVFGSCRIIDTPSVLPLERRSFTSVWRGGRRGGEGREWKGRGGMGGEEEVGVGAEGVGGEWRRNGGIGGDKQMDEQRREVGLKQECQ